MDNAFKKPQESPVVAVSGPPQHRLLPTILMIRKAIYLLKRGKASSTDEILAEVRIRIQTEKDTNFHQDACAEL